MKTISKKIVTTQNKQNIRFQQGYAVKNCFHCKPYNIIHYFQETHMMKQRL